MKFNKTRSLTISAMFLALGILLPQAFHMIPNAGNIFLPMHIPVFVCGFVCGPLFGLLVGIITPIISNIVFSMPNISMLPQMIVELGCYGILTGLLNNKVRIKNKIVKYYIILIITMLFGRACYGLMNYFIFKAGSYSLQIFLTGAFVTCLPGIIVQLLIIPLLVNIVAKYE